MGIAKTKPMALSDVLMWCVPALDSVTRTLGALVANMQYCGLADIHPMGVEARPREDLSCWILHTSCR
jgi:hypothetical protein